MVPILSFFVILILSSFILKTGTVLLKLTGLSYDVARFQARSAFTGTGFTSRESEVILSHPIRRNVISTMMLLGNVGFVTFVSSLVLSFVNVNSLVLLTTKGYYIAGGLFFLFVLGRSKMLDRILRPVMEWALKRITKVHTKDYDNLLNLSGEYEIIKFYVDLDSWLINKDLKEAKLSEEGILILGITRDDGYFIGAPTGNTNILIHDTVVIYGREDQLKALGSRRAGEEGDQEHLNAVEALRARQGLRQEEIKKAKKGRFFGLFKGQ